MPYDWSFYMYDGSLTTPPCHRHTRWIIMRCPIRVSREVELIYYNIVAVSDNSQSSLYLG